MEQTKIWLKEALEFYRRLDFFTSQKSLSTEELATKIMASHGEIIHSSLNADKSDLWLTGDEDMDSWLRLSQRIGPDMVLLSLDETRVWWEDGECDIYPEGQIYEKVLPAWSAISRGAWQIENVKEQWQARELECVDFEWQGDTYEIRPQWDGWLDFELLTPINELIQGSGYAFYPAPTGDQTTYLLVLSESERTTWESERGWIFQG